MQPKTWTLDIYSARLSIAAGRIQSHGLRPRAISAMVEILANQLEGSLLLPEPAILVMMPAESSPPMPLSRFQQSLSFSAALGLSLMPESSGPASGAGSSSLSSCL